MSEADVQKLVVAVLEDRFGDDAVHPLYRFDVSGRIVDVLVEGPVVDFAIEVEDGWESVTTGVGQAELYAAHRKHRPTVPVVVVPDGAIEHPEWDLLRRRGVHVVELSQIQP